MQQTLTFKQQETANDWQWCIKNEFIYYLSSKIAGDSVVFFFDWLIIAESNPPKLLPIIRNEMIIPANVHHLCLKKNWNNLIIKIVCVQFSLIKYLLVIFCSVLSNIHYAMIWWYICGKLKLAVTPAWLITNLWHHSCLGHYMEVIKKNWLFNKSTNCFRTSSGFTPGHHRSDSRYGVSRLDIERLFMPASTNRSVLDILSYP